MFKYNRVMDINTLAYQMPSVGMDDRIPTPEPWAEPPETDGLYHFNKVLSPAPSPEPGAAPSGRQGDAGAGAAGGAGGEASGWQATTKRVAGGRAFGSAGPSPLGSSKALNAAPSAGPHPLSTFASGSGRGLGTAGPSTGASPIGSSRALVVPAAASSPRPAASVSPSPRPGSGGGIGRGGSPQLFKVASQQERMAVAPVVPEEWNPITGSSAVRLY